MVPWHGMIADCCLPSNLFLAMSLGVAGLATGMMASWSDGTFAP